MLRQPPHSAEAEQSVLGGLLLVNDAWDRVGDLLVEGDFYRHEHRLIYAAISSLVSAAKPADVITVFDRLKDMGKEKEVGGLVYLNGLAQSVPTAANIRRYAEIVRERSILRSMIGAADRMATNAYNPKGREVGQLLEEMQLEVMQIGEGTGRGQNRMQSIGSLVVVVTDRLNDLAERAPEDDVVGTPTGFTDLDRKTTGLHDGQLVVLAGRPSMGKSTFALNIAENVAVKEKLPVVIFSLEMGATSLTMQLLSAIGRIDRQAMRTGKLTDFDWGSYSSAVDQLAQAPIEIDETPAVTLGHIRTAARREKRKYGRLGLIVVDYLQLMSGPDGSDENRATAIGDISRGLKALAKEMGCPVIALSQLNRSLEQRTDKRPVMSDLRESGAIEQDADLILFIYRDDYYNKDTDEPGVAEIIIGKQREGPTGTVKLAWLAPKGRFVNLAADYTPPPRAPRTKKKEL